MSNDEPKPICEWCGMEVDPEDSFQNTETPDGWFHDPCLDEKNIAEAMAEPLAALRVGDVIVRGGRRGTVVGFTPRGKLRIQFPGLATETKGWWTWASSLPWKECQVWRGEERIR